MGIFDFFGSRKNGRKLLAQQEEQRKSAERCRQEQQKQQEEKVLSNFRFESNCHLRYEANQLVNGLQVCLRYLQIKKNTNGCSGYKLTNGDGYILSATNGETGKPQFAPKPMRVVKFTDTEILLKGYLVSAKTPFGWQEIDLSDYGFSIFLENGTAQKCVLHMYDRKVDLEYRYDRKVGDLEYRRVSKISKAVPKNIQDIIDAATIGMAAAQKGNHKLEQENLIRLFNLTQEKSSQLLQIPADKYNLVGSGFCLLLEYPQVRANEDVSRAVADYAFFCISKAIKKEPSNKTLYLKRVLVLAHTRKFFFYTVANALNIPDSNPFDITLRAPLIVRTNDYIYAMGKYDFEHGEKISYEGELNEFRKLCYGQYVNKTAADGKRYIDSVNNYIANSISKY